MAAIYHAVISTMAAAGSSVVPRAITQEQVLLKIQTAKRLIHPQMRLPRQAIGFWTQTRHHPAALTNCPGNNVHGRQASPALP